MLNTSLSRGERGGFDPANITHRFVASLRETRRIVLQMLNTSLSLNAGCALQ
jgi:hypothetical protein